MSCYNPALASKANRRGLSCKSVFWLGLKGSRGGAFGGKGGTGSREPRLSSTEPTFQPTKPIKVMMSVGGKMERIVMTALVSSQRGRDAF